MRVKSSLFKSSVVALIAGAFLSLTAYFFFAKIEEQHRELEKETRLNAEEIALDFETSMQAYIGTLSAVERFVASSGDFSFDQFESFSRDYYKDFPAIHALSWNKKVSRDELADFEASVESQGFPSFRVKQRFALGKAGPVDTRPYYFPITYITPFEKNKGAHGFDTNAPDPVAGNVRQKILDQARDEARAITTGRITLVQLESKFGLLVYSPVYSRDLTTENVDDRREHLIGYVAAVFVVPQLLEASAQQAEKLGLAFEIHDFSMPEDKQFLYHSISPEKQEPLTISGVVAASDIYTVSFSVAGHRWEMKFSRSLPRTVEYPWEVLFLGFLAFVVVMGVALALLKNSSSSDWKDPENDSEFLGVSVVVIWIFLLGVLSAVFTSYEFENLEEQKVSREKRADAMSHFHVVQRHVGSSLDILESMGSFFDATQDVTHAEFKNYVAPFIKKDTGAQGFVWIERVLAAQRAEFESKALGAENNQFAIKELRGGVLVRAEDRPEYYPILYVVPQTVNSIVVGFDLASGAVRAAALRSAGDNDQMLASALLDLVVDNKPKPGVVVLRPVYENGDHYKTVAERRKRLSGFAALGYSLEDVFSLSLHNRIDGAHLRVEDVTNPSATELLFSSKTPVPLGDQAVTYTEVIDFAGRQWSISVTPDASAYQGQQHLLSWFVLLSGLVATGLLTFIVLQLTNRGKIVEALVEERTEQLQEAEAFQSLMITTIPDYVYVMDRDCKLIRANPLFMSLYPAELQEKLLGSDLRDIPNPYQIEGFLKNHFALGNDESFEKYKFQDGKIHTLLSKRVSFKDKSGSKFILSLARDVTERERLLRQLTISNEELDEFAYIASHDLKEPLRGIHNHASIYMRKAGDSIDEDGARRLNRIVELTQYMELLVSDLLYFSRVGRTDIAMQPVNLNELVNSVVSSLSFEDGEKVEFSVSDDLPITVCDRTRIGEVFRNLIVNALKYNDSETKMVSVGLVDKVVDGGAQKAFYVQDNGIGIDSGFHVEIFRIFKRLHKKSAYGGGTGSGLTFVKKIIDRHQGKVWVESSLGGGSTFFFTLPNAWSNTDSSHTQG